MAKLYTIYGPMNAGKSAHLLMKVHSFIENGIPVLCLKPDIDIRDGKDLIKSRIGLQHECLSLNVSDNIYKIIKEYCFIIEGYGKSTPQWLFCDEAQFLTSKQVDELSQIVDELNINVMCYCLRTDFKGTLFDGTKRLFEISDTIEEMKNLCSCGKKAVINARVDEYDRIILDGNQIQIGGDENYKVMCRKCFFDQVRKLNK